MTAAEERERIVAYLQGRDWVSAAEVGAWIRDHIGVNTTTGRHNLRVLVQQGKLERRPPLGRDAEYRVPR